jgi:hypothetical protein
VGGRWIAEFPRGDMGLSCVYARFGIIVAMADGKRRS